jgi:putative transposase
LQAELVVAALKNALVLRRPEPGLYFHSDQGSQYSSDAVRKPLTVIGANLSMSAQGNCYENAKAEAFFSTLKGECFPESQVFGTKAEARREIFEYIETYYNNVRLHSALGYQAPSQYETEFLRVIDTGVDIGQSIDAAPEDRALRGRTSSADVALQTAGVAASRRHTGPACRSKPKAKNPRGFGGQSHPIPSTITLKKTENYVSVFSGEVQADRVAHLRTSSLASSMLMPLPVCDDLKPSSTAAINASVSGNSSASSHSRTH